MMNEQEKEALRLQELQMYSILDTPQEQEFDEIIDIAAAVTNCSIALITMLDDKRQWFKAKKGISGCETTKEDSFCQYTIMQDDLFIVEDATKDERFANNPNVTHYPHLRFYAGVPIKSKNGFNIGSLCVVDNKPKQLTTQQKEILQKLSRQVTQLLELRLKNKIIAQTVAEQTIKKEQLQSVNTVHKFIADIVQGKLSNLLDDVEHKISYIRAKELSKEKINKLLNSVHDKIITTSDLMSKFSDIKHIELSHFASNTYSYSISEVINSVLQQYKTELNSRNNRISINLPVNFKLKYRPAHIEFVLKSIMQLINGLIKNTVININCIADDTAMLFVLKAQALDTELVEVAKKAQMIQTANMQFTQEIVSQGGGMMEVDVCNDKISVLFSFNHTIEAPDNDMVGRPVGNLALVKI